MIRGGRAFREARACVRVHHQRVHQSSPATGPTRSRGRHVSRERPTAMGPTRSSQDQTYSTNRWRTRFFFASAASKRSLNVSPTCCMANFSFSASSSSSNDQGARDTGGLMYRNGLVCYFSLNWPKPPRPPLRHVDALRRRPLQSKQGDEEDHGRGERPRRRIRRKVTHQLESLEKM